MAGYRDALAQPEYRALWLGEAVSQIGDQLARVALAVLVYSRTNSALLTALTYALTFVPSLIGGVFLAGLADRYPRRTVMICCDLLAACAAATIAIPGIPLAVAFVAVSVITATGGLFRAARAALTAQIVQGEAFIAALSLRTVTVQVAQLAGFGVGGVVVAALGSPVSMAVDAATFLLSAAIVARWVRSRPPAAKARGPVLRTWAIGISTVWSSPLLRSVWLLGLWASFPVVAEALAAPLASAATRSPWAVGLVMAANPVGCVLGNLAYTWWVPERRRRSLLGPMAVASNAVLLLFLLPLPLWAMIGVIAVAALFLAYQVKAVAMLNEHTPDEARAQVNGWNSTSVIGAQGVVSLAGGWLAQLLDASLAVVLVCAFATVAASYTWWRLKAALTVVA